MKSRDLDLESQGQGHLKVTRAKTLRKMRFCVPIANTPIVKPKSKVSLTKNLLIYFH